MAAPMVILLQLLDVDCEQTGPEIERKLLGGYFFNFAPVGRTHHASSLLSPFNWFQFNG